MPHPICPVGSPKPAVPLAAVLTFDGRAPATELIDVTDARILRLFEYGFLIRRRVLESWERGPTAGTRFDCRPAPIATGSRIPRFA